MNLLSPLKIVLILNLLAPFPALHPQGEEITLSEIRMLANNAMEVAEGAAGFVAREQGLCIASC